MFYQKKSCKKAGAIERFVYSPWGSELKKQTDISKNNINIYARFLSLIKRVILNIWETKVKMKKKTDFIWLIMTADLISTNVVIIKDLLVSLLLHNLLFEIILP